MARSKPKMRQEERMELYHKRTRIAKEIVYNYVADIWNTERRFPFVEEIVDKTDYSKWTVNEALKTLEYEGRITTEPKFADSMPYRPLTGTQKQKALKKLSDALTFEDVANAREHAKKGGDVFIQLHYLTETEGSKRFIWTTIKKVYKHVIMLECGTTIRVIDYAIWLRNPSKYIKVGG